ncbi:hypothetical protein F5Y17DRAFT_260567 [Xylariaceae sp. FL0594]|nr:hypothetical protein F5Y17DRAFT_260567 [Xylariaceae sp. FL0594]
MRSIPKARKAPAYLVLHVCKTSADIWSLPMTCEVIERCMCGMKIRGSSTGTTRSREGRPTGRGERLSAMVVPIPSLTLGPRRAIIQMHREGVPLTAGNKQLRCSSFLHSPERHPKHTQYFFDLPRQVTANNMRVRHYAEVAAVARLLDGFPELFVEISRNNSDTPIVRGHSLEDYHRAYRALKVYLTRRAQSQFILSAPPSHNVPGTSKKPLVWFRADLEERQQAEEDAPHMVASELSYRTYTYILRSRKKDPYTII